MIDKFLEYLAVEKRYSPNTIKSYGKDLDDFQKFYWETEGDSNISRATKKIVRNFMMKLSTSEISKRSINRKLSSLRGFYLFLLKIGEIEVSPMETVKSLKFNAEKQMPFSEEEMEKLRTIMEQDAVSLLDRLVVETLYQTGMRREELCNLEYSAIDFHKKEMKVLGKGNKMRIIPFSNQLSEGFQLYIKERNPLPESEKYFFVTEKGKKMTGMFVYSIVKSYLSLVTLKKKRSPHILRHSFATHTLNNGAEISKIKKILGHQSIASTQGYTDVDINQLKKVFNSTHPRANRKEKE